MQEVAVHLETQIVVSNQLNSNEIIIMNAPRGQVEFEVVWTMIGRKILTQLPSSIMDNIVSKSFRMQGPMAGSSHNDDDDYEVVNRDFVVVLVVEWGIEKESVVAAAAADLQLGKIP
jgi:hypothetical protein